MRVGMDLDGCNFMFGENLRGALLQIAMFTDPAALPAVFDTWEFYRGWGMTTEGFLTACHAAADAGYLFTGPAVEGAAAAWWRLVDAGHTIHVVTDRGFGSHGGHESRRNTAAWLLEHDFPFHSLTFAADKTSVPADVFCEDKLSNYDALEAAGVRAYLINQPWNAIPGGDGRRRVGSVHEFADAVLALRVSEDAGSV